MAKIIVSLISEQSAPNIMFIKQFGSQADKFIFISTKEMEDKHKSQATIQAAGIHDKSIEIIKVDPNSFEEIPKKIIFL